MKKTFLAIVLGLLAPIVFILGAEPFEVRGRNSLGEIAAGCVAVFLYLAFCQYQVAPPGAQDRAARRSAVIAMAAPLLASVVFMACVEQPRVVLEQGLPMLLAGLGGILVGAALAARRAAKPKAKDRISPAAS